MRQTLPLLTPYEVLKLLGHQWHEVRYGLWLAVAAGLAVCVVTGRYRRLLRGSVVVTAFIIMTSALTFAETFGPPMEYSVRFFVATALLPIVFGAVVVIINLGLRHRRLALAAVGTLLLLFPTVGSLFRPYRDMKEIHAIARFIADENPLGSRVELDSNNKMVSTIFSPCLSG